MGKRKGKNKNAKPESSEKPQFDPKARKVFFPETSAESMAKQGEELQERKVSMAGTSTAMPGTSTAQSMGKPDEMLQEKKSEIAQSQLPKKPDQKPEEEKSQIAQSQLPKKPDQKPEEKKREITHSQLPERPEQKAEEGIKVIPQPSKKPDKEAKKSKAHQSDDSIMQISSSTSKLQISEQCPTTSSHVPEVPEITAIDPCSSSQAITEIPAAKRQEIIDDFSDKMVITQGLARKLPPGKLGRKVKLTCNWFPINLLPDGNVYHYDVEITNRKMSEKSDLSTLVVDKSVARYRCLSTKINRKVIDTLLKGNSDFKNSYAVYDGRRNMYTPSLLKLKFPYKTEVIVQDKPSSTSIKGADLNKSNPPKEAREEDIFKVTIKPVEKKDGNKRKTSSCAISFEPLHELFSGRKPDVSDIQEAVMALETIFRHSPALKFVPIGRNFFHPHLGDLHPLGGGIEIWFGYHQSSRLGQWKPMINLDTTATVFFSKISLLEYFANLINKNVRQLSNYIIASCDIEKMSKELKNIKVKTTHSKRIHNIIEVTRYSANDLEFEMQENGKVIKKSVANYFKQKYEKVKLIYPNLPCVRVRPQNKKIYIPLELCEIVEGQHCNKDLSPDEQREMIKYTAQPPKDKFKKIKTIREQHANYESDEYLKKFNIQVANDPIQVMGRELEAPNLNYKNNMKLKPRNGSWNIRGAQFYEGVSINSCTIVSLADKDKVNGAALGNFKSQLCQIAKAAGMSITINSIDICEKNQLPRKFREIKSINVQLVVVVIPFKSKILYRQVKQIAEVEVGLMTQCIDHTNVLKSNGSVLANLCQKINAKMGGTNHTLTSGEIPKVMAQPVIIMGADVSHAGVTDMNKISVAAVVGSIDMTLSRFAVTCKLQKNENENKMCLEIIAELKVMVKNLLQAFHAHTRQKPRRIIFYRDGVSEGQFSKVKKEELVAIRAACTELQVDYKPLITYVVVQKRHHTRFMPTDSRYGVGSEGNINPGTVVDTDVVHPVHRDFYLCSHYGLKGTSRPAHYTILSDDSEFTADEFQVLTHYLCHTFARCTKSISHPVPVRYAHLAAYRIRLLLPPSKTEFGTKQKSVQESQDIPQDILKSFEIQDAIKKRMYFV